MCARRVSLESEVNPSLGSHANVALSDGPHLVRRKMLAAMGWAASGVAMGWPGVVWSADVAPTLQSHAAPNQPVPGHSLPPTFAQSYDLATLLIRDALDKTDTSSISMALISKDGLVWNLALGNLSDTAKTPVSPDTLYCIGSCSKLVATVAALQLVDRGLIGLDAPVVQYLPAFSMLSPQYTAVTVRMLLNHQSGFPGTDYSNGFTTLPFTGYADQVLQTLTQTRLKHVPGEMSVYCNDGFTLVELVVRAVTGLDYHDYVQRNILDPLGMSASRYAVQLFPKGAFAPGRSPSGQLFLECINVHASGGLFTTPSEMAQFARIFLNNGVVDGVTLLSQASIQAMSQLQAVNEALRPVPVEWGFGLGWDDVRQGAFATSNIRAWRKNGGTLVYGSDFYVLPDHELAVMITGTSTAYKPDAIAEQVLYQALVEKGSLTRMPEKFGLTAGKAVSPYAVNAADLQGIYANYQAIFRVSMAAQPDVVQVHKWEGGHWSENAIWKRRADGLFADTDKPATAFGLARQGEQRYLTLHMPSGAGYSRIDLAFAQALTAQRPVPEAWTSRLGRTWVVINERYTSLALAGGGPALTLFAVPELPGFVGVNAEPASTENQLLVANEPDAARMCLNIPYTMSRDLNDLLAETYDGQEYLRLGRMLAKPLEAFAQLEAGGTLQATVSPHGHALGVRAAQALQLQVQGALAAFVYNADLEPVFPDQFRADIGGVVKAENSSGTTQKPARLRVPQGGLVLLYGVPGNVVSVTAAV